MNLKRLLQLFLTPVFIAGSTSGCTPPALAGEPLAPVEVAAKWEVISLLHARHFHTATILADGRVFVAGGDDYPDVISDKTEIYDPSIKQFLPGPFLGGSRKWHSAALIGNGVLIAGGLDLLERPPLTVSTALVVRLAKMSRYTVGSMVVARQQFTMQPLLDNTILVFGGAGRGRYLIAETYDPQKARFERTGDLLVNRFNCPATLLQDGRVLLTGGTSSDKATYNKRIADAELYEPSTKKFTKTGSMKRSRSGHTSTLLADGRVLITGGINEEEGLTASAEIYNPKTATFRELSPMHIRRNDHAAVLLADGRVLITGGASYIGRNSVILRSAEVFDPRTEKFLIAEPMPTTRQGHTATLLKSGDVLLVGGWTIESGAAKTALLWSTQQSR